MCVWLPSLMLLLCVQVELSAVVGSLEQLEKERDSLEHQCSNLRQQLEQQEESNQQVRQTRPWFKYYFKYLICFPPQPGPFRILSAAAGAVPYPFPRSRGHSVSFPPGPFRILSPGAVPYPFPRGRGHSVNGPAKLVLR